MNGHSKFIAEIGVNHEGNIETALKMIQQTAAAGCWGVKFQAYTASGLSSKNAASYWDTSKEGETSQYELFKKHELYSFEIFEALRNEAKKCNLQFGLSIFDLELMESLSPLCDFIKIASADITFHKLINAASKLNVPLFISTGAAYVDEIQMAISAIDESFNSELCLMHCSLSYPSDIFELNMAWVNIIRSLADKKIQLGYSDHVPPGEDTHFVIARALGVEYFEKHFTDDKTKAGNDHYHSGDLQDFADLIDKCKRVDQILGVGGIRSHSEFPARDGARRSLYFSRNKNAGDLIADGDLVALRPSSGGIAPFLECDLIGRKLSVDVMNGAQVKREFFN